MWIDVALPHQKPRKVFAMSDWNNRNDCQCKHIYFITSMQICMYATYVHVRQKDLCGFCLFIVHGKLYKSSTANFVTFRISCHGLRQSKAERTNHRKVRVVASFRMVREPYHLSSVLNPCYTCHEAGWFFTKILSA